MCRTAEIVLPEQTIVLSLLRLLYLLMPLQSATQKRNSYSKMFQKVLSHSCTRVLMVLFVGSSVLVCMYPHLVERLSWVVNYAVQLMLLFFFAGLIFLFLKQPQLTFILFAGTTILNVYLKYAVKSDGIEPWRQAIIKERIPAPIEESLTVAQINLSDSKGGSAITTAIRTSGADLISFHGVTPNWDLWLKDSLSDLYPNQLTMVDIGLYGMAVFSKFPLALADTIIYNGIPNLAGCINKQHKTYCFISVHTEPALNAFSLKRLREHLDCISQEAARFNNPLIVMGEFNAVSWSEEIQVFLNSTDLHESRAGFMSETSSLWSVPLNHIFFSGRFQCLNFGSLKDATSRYLGIIGTYQLKPSVRHAKKTAQ